jgi:hypothetical protein
MMLSGRNEWIAIGVLIVYIAFIPCPGFMTEFFSSSIGKMIALAGVAYVIKYVSVPVALLMFIALDRRGAIREGADDPSMIPMTATDSEFTCPSEFLFDTSSKQCKKGSEMKMPNCSDPAKIWNLERGVCVSKSESMPTPPPSTGAGGPPGGSTGSAAAMAALDAEMPSTTTENFTPYGGVDAGFSPV